MERHVEIGDILSYAGTSKPTVPCSFYVGYIKYIQPFMDVKSQLCLRATCSSRTYPLLTHVLSLQMVYEHLTDFHREVMYREMYRKTASEQTEFKGEIKPGKLRSFLLACGFRSTVLPSISLQQLTKVRRQIEFIEWASSFVKEDISRVQTLLHFCAKWDWRISSHIDDNAEDESTWAETINIILEACNLSRTQCIIAGCWCQCRLYRMIAQYRNK